MFFLAVTAWLVYEGQLFALSRETQVHQVPLGRVALLGLKASEGAEGHLAKQ